MMNKKLIAVRKARKITQADIATFLKISQTQYQKREAGKIEISKQEWENIAKLLDVSVEDIFEDFKKKLTNQYDILIQEIETLKLKLLSLEKGK